MGPTERQDAEWWLGEGKGPQRKWLEGNGTGAGPEGYMGFGRGDLQQGRSREESMPWTAEVTSLTALLGIRLDQCMVGDLGWQEKGLHMALDTSAAGRGWEEMAVAPCSKENTHGRKAGLGKTYRLSQAPKPETRTVTEELPNTHLPGVKTFSLFFSVFSKVFIYFYTSSL